MVANRSSAGQSSANGALILLLSASIQVTARIGARPMSRPGAATSQIQASASLGKLISASSVPVNAKSECRSGLEASSSISPPRGSMTGLMPPLPPVRANRDPAAGRRPMSRPNGLLPETENKHDPPGAVQHEIDAHDQA